MHDHDIYSKKPYEKPEHFPFVLSRFRVVGGGWKSKTHFVCSVLQVGGSSELLQTYCSGQVISDSEISFFDVDSRSKELGERLPSF